MAPAIALRDVLAARAADAQLAEAGRLLLLHSHLSPRDDGGNKADPSEGVLDPHDMNNVGFFFLFALIGVAFVLTGIWFFFWAKNGGFHFRDDDWDDYKSTVLRRRGPNGTLLSNATKSTKLGGGSVYRKYDEDEDERDDWDGGRTEITESTALSGITAGPSDIYAREKREEKRRRREAERRKKRSAERSKDRGKDKGGGKKKSRSRTRGAGEGVMDEEAEKEAREQLRNYREERPARVGGLNKTAEGSDWEGSTNPAGSMLSSGMQSSASALSSAVTATEAASAAPPPPPYPSTAAAAGGGGGGGPPPPPSSSSTSKAAPKGGGIRKVYSVADRTTARENERLRAEARRLREEGRSARRDMMYQRAIGGGAAGARDEQSESLLSGAGSGGGGGGGGGGSSVESSALSREGGGGTKSYHHPLPELREHWRREREEKRVRKGGYQRGNSRDEELEDEVD